MSFAAKRLPHSYGYWAELALLVCLVTGVLVLVNYIAYRHNVRFDLTPEKSYSLAPHTLRALDTLTEDLKLTVFYKRREQDVFLELVELFSRASDHFSCTFVELDKNPARAEALGIKSYGAGILSYQGRQEKLAYFSEDELVSAIIRLTEKTDKVVRFVRGHGEKSIRSEDPQAGYSTILQALRAENFTAQEILLLQAGSIPGNTLVLVVCGPQKDFFEQELDIIAAYLEGGGRVLLLCDPVRLPRLTAFLQRYRVQLTNDFVIDTQNKLLDLDSLTPIVIPDRSHPVFRHVNQAVVFPYCRSVLPVRSPGETSAATVLVRSGPDSWAERDYQSVYDGRPAFDADRDLQGPVPVGVVVNVGAEPSPGRLVVLGDSDFANNHYHSILGNRDFFLNTINWLAEKSSLLSSRSQPRGGPVSMLFLTENESRLILWSAVILQPLLFLLVGIVVVLVRRVRR